MQEAANDAATPGARLAAERERLGLSRADVAQRLHMSVSQVEALEDGDYARLPRGMFLRGFIRNYAKVVGLDGQALLAALAEGGPREARPGIVVNSQNIRFDAQPMSSPYVKAGGMAVTAVLVALAGMYWLFFVRPTPPTTVVRKPEVTAPVATAPAPAGPDAAPAEPLPVPGGPITEFSEPAPPPSAGAPPQLPAATPPTAVAVPVKGASQEPAKAPSLGEKVLHLKFRGASWVEIRDGRGRMLVSQVHRGGSEAQVSGRGPFAVIVGNAPEVRLSVDDAPFDLEPHTRVAVARVTIP